MGYLTGPVNSLADFQLEYAGLLMGPSTPYTLESDANLLDLASVKSMDQARTWADGSWSGPDFSDVLLPELPVTVWAPTATAFAAAWKALQLVTGPQPTAQQLWVKYPNQALLGVGAKVNQRAFPITPAGLLGALRGSIQFRCPDPAWQSIPRTVTLQPGSAAVGGMMFPLFDPVTAPYVSPGVLDFGITTSGQSQATLTNAGNTPAWPVVVVSGPVTNFTIVLDGNVVTFTGTVPAGQTLTIDYKTGLATLTGNVDRTYALTARNFSAVTSSSAVFFSATSGSCQVTVADLWR